ncbi:beta-galactoside alpha-2,6-sialyltransferase 1, partial [Agrilus planipennis]|uniref:Beta-galactoside alpha-2,6-sialyltransferase 1 n=1 Tax=Agrilus planipennis TaxID=224129 RepID=A0A7F5QZ66_AGRPL
LPRKELFDNRYFKSCAVVASSGALRGSNLGRTIDSYNVVLRFNNAPTKGFESDVGRKTTLRIVNSQVVSKEGFLQSKLFENVTLVVWDPSNYTSTLEDWYHHPEHQFFTNYRKYKTKFLKSRFFIVNPKSLWDLWTFLQSSMIYRIRKNPPSSGFLGISILLPHCDYVDVFEYIPSVRVSRRCHYYDRTDNPACTFGVWHPLAAEKLLSYFLNTANDTSVFQTGFIRIPGYQVTQ